MKTITAALAGAVILLSGVANAQYVGQARVSGQVLSYGPQGFMLEGPDGNYGIEVGQTTIVTDPWNTFFVTGPGNVMPGDYVTATGYPTGQWIMRATQVVVRNANPPVYRPVNSFVGGSVIFGNDARAPGMLTPIPRGTPNTAFVNPLNFSTTRSTIRFSR